MTTAKLGKLTVSLDDGLWTVEDRSSKRWWTSTGSDEAAHIMNEELNTVKPGSVLGKRIREAVRAAEKPHANATSITQTESLGSGAA